MMRNSLKTKLAASLFVPAIVLAGAAFAQSDKAMTGTQAAPAAAAPVAVVFVWDAKTFERLDTNNDGRISREEAQGDATMKDNWSKLDGTNRGSVSRTDFEDYGRKLNPNSAYPKGHPFDGTKK